MGAQISVTESGGTYTFTSGTSTGTLTGTIAGYVVPASTTFSISSVLASGKVFSGTGTALVVANTAGENLTSFSATGVGGYQLTSGQNYTLTAAQGAIGRIGATGTAGALTDAGTITVRDTLAALGGGVGATLKTNGADSVVATTTAGADISAITVGGIDSIVLVAGNYTVTAAQAALWLESRRVLDRGVRWVLSHRSARIDVLAEVAHFDAVGALISRVPAMLRGVERDRLDKERKTSPLVIPEGAVIIDNSHITLDQAVEQGGIETAGFPGGHVASISRKHTGAVALQLIVNGL